MRCLVFFRKNCLTGFFMMGILLNTKDLRLVVQIDILQLHSVASYLAIFIRYFIRRIVIEIDLS